MTAAIRRYRLTHIALLFSSACIAGAATGFQQSDAEREQLERVEDILKALGVKDGLQVADVGSADGFYTIRIARGVAPAGRAYGVDIRAEVLEKLEQRMLRDKVVNFDVIQGEPNDPKLPAGELLTRC